MSRTKKATVILLATSWFLGITSAPIASIIQHEWYLPRHPYSAPLNYCYHPTANSTYCVQEGN